MKSKVKCKCKKCNNTWELTDKLLTIGIKDLGVEAKIQKVGLTAFIHLDNIIVAQEKKVKW